MDNDPGRFCKPDEIWVCRHCGKHVEHDRYKFDDESCMLNAIAIKESLCVYKDDDKNQRVTEVKHEHPMS